MFRNGAVYTVDAARSWASAVAVRGGRIVYVGTDSLPPGLMGARTEVVDLHGSMLLPGFQDAHVHPISSGVGLGECNVDAATSVREVGDSIRVYAAAHPDLAWIRGSGWQLPLFPAANPSKALLDSLVPDRPALLWSADGHSAWVNSRALQLAGIGPTTPDPANGRIERDARTGEPSGTLRESASELVEPCCRTAPRRSWRGGSSGPNGWRVVRPHNALLGADGRGRASRFTDADRAGTLSVRVIAALTADGEFGDTMLARLQDWRRRYATPHVRPVAVKLFEDGVIEARTAALLAPYLDRHGDAGTPVRDQAELDRMTAALDRAGFQIHIHAIGDRAIRMSLDALERAVRPTARGTRGPASPTCSSSTRPTSRAFATSAWWPTSRRCGRTGTST